MRPDAPAAIVTPALGHRNRWATKAISSSLARPSMGADFTRATQVPSADCSSEADRDFGFTLILRDSSAMISAAQRVARQRRAMSRRR
jgi:hypothetical protein